MKKTGIFYGSSTGNAENVAKMIAEKLGAEAFDVANSPSDELSQYDNLILGTSTTGAGEIQDDWYDFLTDLEQTDLKGKNVAIFGLGDSISYADTFVGSMAVIYEAVKDKGCTIVGAVNADDYEYDDSEAVIEGKFVGLPLDEDNEDEKTEERVDNWLEILKENF